MSWSVHFWEMSPKEQAVVGIAMELAGDDPEVQDNAAWCRFTLCHSHPIPPPGDIHRKGNTYGLVEIQ